MERSQPLLASLLRPPVLATLPAVQTVSPFTTSSRAASLNQALRSWRLSCGRKTCSLALRRQAWLTLLLYYPCYLHIYIYFYLKKYMFFQSVSKGI